MLELSFAALLLASSSRIFNCQHAVPVNPGNRTAFRSGVEKVALSDGGVDHGEGGILVQRFQILLVPAGR